MLLELESLANGIVQASTALNNILAVGNSFNRDSDSSPMAIRRRAIEALQGALTCLPSLEAGLGALEAQLSRQDDSQARICCLSTFNPPLTRFYTEVIVRFPSPSR